MRPHKTDPYRDDDPKDQLNPRGDEKPSDEGIKEHPRGLSDELVDGATVDLKADPGRPI
jgi:hypothetical protein